MLSIRKGRRTSQSGFTLMELLVVLVILGFLLGMVLPRLGSIADNAVDTVCDSNNKGIRYFTKLYLDEKGRYPNELINLVDQTDVAATAAVALGVSDLTEDGADSLHPDFATRTGYALHALTTAEVTALKAWGISTVRQYKGGSTTTPQSYEKESIVDGMMVATVGDMDTAALTSTNLETAIEAVEGNPFWFGRIMLGIGESSSLVTGGYIQAAALCPGGIQNADVVDYNNYVLILPRLEASFATGGPLEDVANAVVEITADDGSRVEEFTLEAQEKWNFDMACPEGHKWPDNDNDTWEVTAVTVP